MHDAHIHLAMEPLKSNLPKIMDTFLEKGGKYILTQSTDLEDIESSLEIGAQYQNTIGVALGLHPTFFQENTIDKGDSNNIYEESKKLLNNFCTILEKSLPQITAIGETGLDYYQIGLQKDLSPEIKREIKEIQKESFRKHIQIAVKNNLPLSIHARDVNGSNECVEDIVDIVAKEGKGLARGCFHSYTGDIKYLQSILDLGFCVGFNAIITYKSGEDVRKILKETPIDRILFETDGPFLPPQSVRRNKKIKNKYAQPGDVKEVIEVAAGVKNLLPEELEREADNNYERVFGK
ncbi:MAG TPA: TatD family hydrolase [Candidatus Dojkabacteria bacterium]|nr:TatD family hydrolase [Candidatus Dojkabacteria bacterium]